MPLREQLLEDGQDCQIEQFALGDSVAEHVGGGLHVGGGRLAQGPGQGGHAAATAACGQGVVALLLGGPLGDRAVNCGHFAFV